MNEDVAVTVTILDKDYPIKCPETQANELRNAAALLDARMREVRATGNVIGSDRVAVVAALNIAHELLQKDDSDRNSAQLVGQRIRNMHQRIEDALAS